MRKLAAFILLSLVMAAGLVSCGEDVKPKRPIVDKLGVVFIENGSMDTVPTQFTAEELRDALLKHRWEFSYSFFYDDYKIGPKGEDRYYSRFSYDYKDDGTVKVTDVSKGTTEEWTYTLSGRTVVLKTATSQFSFVVIAMDDRHMVCDESLAGESANGYDSATLKRRMIFLSRKK